MARKLIAITGVIAAIAIVSPAAQAAPVQSGVSLTGVSLTGSYDDERPSRPVKKPAKKPVTKPNKCTNRCTPAKPRPVKTCHASPGAQAVGGFLSKIHFGIETFIAFTGLRPLVKPIDDAFVHPILWDPISAKTCADFDTHPLDMRG